MPLKPTKSFAPAIRAITTLLNSFRPIYLFEQDSPQTSVQLGLAILECGDIVSRVGKLFPSELPLFNNASRCGWIQSQNQPSKRAPLSKLALAQTSTNFNDICIRHQFYTLSHLCISQDPFNLPYKNKNYNLKVDTMVEVWSENKKDQRRKTTTKRRCTI